MNKIEVWFKTIFQKGKGKKRAPRRALPRGPDMVNPALGEGLDQEKKNCNFHFIGDTGRGVAI